MSLLALAGLWFMVALAGREAWLDKTPRRPWSWRRLDLDWWAVRRTKRELARAAMPMAKEL